MKILFITCDVVAIDLTRRLVEEGHEVRLYIDRPDYRTCFDGLVGKAESLEAGKAWLGRAGLAIFDDVGFGEIQSAWRREGYNVLGSSAQAERLETDRVFGQSTFRAAGLATAPLFDFTSLDEAITFAECNRRAWVVKFNQGHSYDTRVTVGERGDGADVIDALKAYRQNGSNLSPVITLQARVWGVEIGVARYFNGKDWVAPVEYSIEHKRLLNGDLGPLTDEMGTLAWYAQDDSEALYKTALAPMAGVLRACDFRGDFALNLMVNESGIYPLEATSRLGCPIIHLQDELHLSPWGDFLLAVAQGRSYDLAWSRGYGIVVFMALPPYPYGAKDVGLSCQGTNLFLDNLSPADLSHLHFEEIASRDGSLRSLYVAGSDGFPLYVTGRGSSIVAARDQTYELVKKVCLPKAIYRTDIGLPFLQEGLPQLQAWGYLRHLVG
ncbi:MAG: hypothetical protein AAF530_07300 [Pseudomonadota bacterium]